MTVDLRLTLQRLALLREVDAGEVFQTGNGETTSTALGRPVRVTNEIRRMEQAGWVQLVELRLGAKRWDLTDVGRQLIAAGEPT